VRSDPGVGNLLLFLGFAGSDLDKNPTTAVKASKALTGSFGYADTNEYMYM